jgi:hypothetical protein
VRAAGARLGLTLGRFLISPIAARAGATTARMMYACLVGVTAAAALAWLSQFVGWWPIARRLRPGSLRLAAPGAEAPRRGPGRG